MAQARPVRWLHLSDLHLGCRGRGLWWQVQEEFEASIVDMVGRLGAPDLILLTGDLTNSGAAKEFELVDRFLDALLGWIRGAGDRPDPLVLAVPGNHDLIRPRSVAALPYRVLEKYQASADDEDVQMIEEVLWKKRDASFIAPLFADYAAWFERRIESPLASRAKDMRRSHFPCDFLAELDVQGAFPLAIVGLNSTWQQYRSGDFEGRLVVPAEQFQSALSAGGSTSPFKVFKRCPRALLLMHQPPTWLAPRARKIFFESIYNPKRFDLCLYGHLHSGRAEEIAIAGGPPRCFFQSPSLFGLAHYGSAREHRAIGFAWGSLAPDGRVKVWPMKRVVRSSGEALFVRDGDFPEDPSGVVICGARRPPEIRISFEVVITTYLEDLVDHTDHINISGIATEHARGALRHPIERLYTPLSSRGGIGESGLQPERSALAEILPRHRRLLIEGQPGAGKTTFLRFVACMLSRDVLGIPCPGGGPWRRRYLGLDAGTAAKIPLLLRLNELVTLLTAEDAPPLRKDNRQWILDLLERSGKEDRQPVSREYWEELLADDNAILLLDGLDEATDEGLRRRILAIFRDACRHWRCRVVVTSRPIDTAPLQELDFYRTVLEPFGEEEIRTFVDHWVAALHAVEEGTAGGEAKSYREALTEAVVGRARVRRLATNPVMLTCLCVVHWHERRLPEGRARVYRAVLRWLIDARSVQRKAEGFTDLLAWRGFALLALRMMGATGASKRVVVDLGEAAAAVAPLFARERPELTSSEDLRLEARRWLAFEGLGSGIVEEVAGRRLRFWHLTFQEFLAALQLAWRGDGEDPQEDWWPIVREHLDDAQWRETVELTPGCLFDEGGVGRVDRLLGRVLQLQRTEVDLATEARVAGVLGRLLQPLGVLDYRPSADISAAYNESLERSLAIFTRKGAAEVPIEVRIEAAEALGRGGDPRLAPGVDNFLDLPGTGAWRLSKYPVSVEEFQRFLEARGYEDQQYWGKEGWSTREREEWEKPDAWEDQLHYPNRPVTGVSWYEAEAYCRWLGDQRGYEVRLPSEAEWEMAAKPAEGKYPWGRDEPGPEHANFRRAFDAPTPVGIYPAGDGICGHSDLGGNVWEWCTDRIDELGGTNIRSVRGGCWDSSAGYLGFAFRNWFQAAFRSKVIGLRVLALIQ